MISPGAMTKGTVFDIREFTVHDGPGGRITFFLKGCPLRCTWCHNPEGQRNAKEIMVKDTLCTHCGNCKKDSGSDTYRKYARDPAGCPRGLVSVCGVEYTARDVLDRVLPLKDMLNMTEGGVTFSGGEPLLQSDFLAQSLDMLHQNGIHTAIETCGYASEEVFERIVLERCDYVMMDIKLADSVEHMRYTGVDNALILRNANALMASGIPFVFRTPLIPDITDTQENLDSIKAFIGDSPWEKIPYNNLAGAKYSMLGREYDYHTPIKN